MIPAFPTDESERLATLQRLEILDTLPEQPYDDLTLLASQICGAPIAMLALIDADRQWYKSTVGTPIRETARDLAFCAHAILEPDAIFTVEDAAVDARFVDNPHVAGEPHIRFYAGAPIVMTGGHAVGTLCVIDTRPRTLTDPQRECLAALARQASALLDLRDKARSSERLAREHEQLSVEAQLKQKRGMELLELVLRGGQMGLWDLHVPSGVWTVNAREQMMLGYAGVHAATDKLDWRALVHPDDWPLLRDAMEPHMNGRATFYEATHRMRHADGHYIWIIDRGVIVERNVRGEALRIVGTHVDVTESKRVADEQHRDAERLALALSGGEHGLWDWHVATGKVVRNEQWAAMLGYSLAEIERIDRSGSFWKSVLHPDDYALSQAALQRHLRRETPQFEAEVRMRHKSGRWLWVLDRAKVVERDAAGNAVRVAGTNMNITERKNGELALQEATELLVRTGRMARVGGWELDVATRRIRWTEEVYRIHDLNRLEKPDLSQALDFFTPESRAILEPAIDAAMTHGTPWDLTLSLVTARGRAVWIRTIANAEVRDGRIVRLQGTVQDLTERKLAEERLSASEQRLRGITDNIPVLIAEIDPEGRFRFVNDTYRSWLGLEPTHMIGERVGDAVGDAYFAARRDYLHRACSGEKVSFEMSVVLPAGERWLQTTYLPHFDAAGAVAGVYALTSDITELKAIQCKLDALARSDALTGLANRMQLEEELGAAMARSRRTGASLAVLYVDIDRFKSINDTHGHAGGDAVLVEFGHRLQAGVRETDVVGRQAGDEFVVILEGVADALEAQSVADKLVVAMRPPFTVLGRPVSVTTSIGMAIYGGEPLETATLLSRADRALYDAKAGGRDRVAVSLEV